MGTLKTFNFDLNDSAQVRSILSLVRNHVENNRNAYRILEHKPPYYFAIAGEPVITDPGWYIILSGTVPIYVGTAGNLNKRLNSDTGTTDNYGKQARKNDCERNFIKKFSETGIINSLRVVAVPEGTLNREGVTEDDRKEIEKLINIFRSSFRYINP